MQDSGDAETQKEDDRNRALVIKILQVCMDAFKVRCSRAWRANT